MSVLTGGFADPLRGTTVSSVQQMGWGGLKNGALLEVAQVDFDVFLTGDRNLTFQQTLSKFNIAVVVLQAESIQLQHTLPIMPKVLTLLPTLQPGWVINVSS